MYYIFKIATIGGEVKMEMYETINKLAIAYNDVMWNKFANCFHKVEIQDNILVQIPADIVNVLVHILGYEETKNWVLKKISYLDNQSVIELVKNEKGIKAVKMFVLSMPN